MKSVNAALLISICVGSVFCATKICRDVAPGKRGQTDSCPYQIQIDQVQIEIDGTIEIYLNGESNAKGFREVLMMAFAADNDKEPIGEFYSPSENLKIMSCPGLTNGAVTHKSGWVATKPKSFESVKWKPPDGFLGDVVFRATFVQSRKIYWILQDASIPITLSYQSAAAKLSAAAGLTAAPELLMTVLLFYLTV